MADELANQVVTRHRDQVALAHMAELLEYLGHAHRNRGLAGAGVAGEAHVQRRRGRLQAVIGPQLVIQQQRGDVMDAAFHRCEADQFGIQSVKHHAHARGFEHRVRGGRKGGRIGRGVHI